MSDPQKPACPSTASCEVTGCKTPDFQVRRIACGMHARDLPDGHQDHTRREFVVCQAHAQELWREYSPLCSAGLGHWTELDGRVRSLLQEPRLPLSPPANLGKSLDEPTPCPRCNSPMLIHPPTGDTACGNAECGFRPASNTPRRLRPITDFEGGAVPRAEVADG